MQAHFVGVFLIFDSEAIFRCLQQSGMKRAANGATKILFSVFFVVFNWTGGRVLVSLNASPAG